MPKGSDPGRGVLESENDFVVLTVCKTVGYAGCMVGDEDTILKVRSSILHFLVFSSHFVIMLVIPTPSLVKKTIHFSWRGKSAHYAPVCGFTCP